MKGGNTYRAQRIAWWVVLIVVMGIVLVYAPTFGDALAYLCSNPAFPILKSSGSPAYSMGILESLSSSLVRVLGGTLMGFTGGVLTGLCLSQWGYLGPRLNAIMLFFAPVAPLVWLPLFLRLFGIGHLTFLAVVAAASIFVASIVTYYVATHPPQPYVDVLEMMGATRWQTVRHVVVPSVVPTLFLLLRLNLFSGWMAMLAAEMAGADVGLGAMLMMGRSLGNPAIITTAAALIVVTSFALDCSVSAFARRYIRQRYGLD